MSDVVLVTGAFGQIGSQLVPRLQSKYGKKNVVALAHHNIPENYDGELEKGSVTDKNRIQQIIQNRKITVIYHLAAVLSAVGEKKPDVAWDVNLIALKHIFDLSVENKLRVFWASSMAVWGETTPKELTAQRTIMQPTTLYGVTKLSGELLAQYYHQKYQTDIRSVRYPGLISWAAEPGGGTTDYAVAIFYDAIKTGKYECFVSQDTVLPMMYMEDAIRATLELMDAPAQSLTVWTSYNLAAISFSVKQLVTEIKKHIPHLEVTYQPDYRQQIADSWVNSVDDSQARTDWQWEHKVDLSKLVSIMLQNLKQKLSK